MGVRPTFEEWLAGHVPPLSAEERQRRRKEREARHGLPQATRRPVTIVPPKARRALYELALKVRR